MPKILLVDDEKAVKWALQQALMDEGYETETANSGEEGLLKAKENNFDLVISDLRMPGISGIEMLRELKEHQPSLKAIVCSAYGSMESVVEAMRLGVNDFMVKPFKIAAMKAAIAAILPTPSEGASPLPTSKEKSSQKVSNLSPSSSAVMKPLKEVMPELLVRPSLPCRLIGSMDPQGHPRPSEGVFFDVAEQNGKHLILFGSSPRLGASAQALSLLVRGIFRSQISHTVEPKQTVINLNETLWKSFHPRPSISLFYGLFDQESEELYYVCTGDLVVGCIRRSNGKDELLDIERSPLGLFPGVMAAEKKIKIEAGDRLILLGTARTELLSHPPGVEESFMNRVLPEVNWQDSQELAHKIYTEATTLGTTQSPSEITVAVLEPVTVVETATRREISLSSQEQNLQPLLVQLGGLGQKAKISTELMHDITTAIIEAVNNAQTHAYPKDGEGPISVQMALSNGEIVVEICDEGIGFDINNYRPPDLQGYEALTTDHGRGIYLIQQLMDRTLIESRSNQGTIVHMAKRLGA